MLISTCFLYFRRSDIGPDSFISSTMVLSPNKRDGVVYAADQPLEVCSDLGTIIMFGIPPCDYSWPLCRHTLTQASGSAKRSLRRMLFIGGVQGRHRESRASRGGERQPSKFA